MRRDRLLRPLAILALAVFSAGTIAQPAPASAVMPPCWPKSLGGSGEGEVTLTSDVSQAVGYWCDVAGALKKTALVWGKAHVLRLPTTGACALSVSACRDAVWAANAASAAVVSTEDETHLLGRVSLALDGTRPKRAWAVAPNGTATTRPAYELRDGKLYTSSARATVGDPCDLERAKFANSSAVYGAIPQPVDTSPVLVAVCKLK